MMFDFMDCVDKCLGRPWRFPITGGYKLVTQFSTYSNCILYHKLTAMFFDTTTLPSDCMVFPILSASGFTDNFQLCVQGHVLGGCI